MEGEGRSGSTPGLDEKYSSGSTSSGDRCKGEEGEEWSKKREDRAHRQREGREEE